MKIFMPIIIIGLVFLSSCVGNNSGKDEKNQQSESSSQLQLLYLYVTLQAIDIDKCDKFLNKYEAWSEDYIKVLETFTSNPADPKLAQEYNKLSREYASWTNEWFEFVDCAKKDEFFKRYEAINRKIERKQKALRGG